MNEKLTKLRQKLTERQAKFVQLIRSGQDRAEAYQNAGFKPKNRRIAQQAASRLLTTNSKVIAYFEASRTEDGRKVNISRIQQLNHLDAVFNMAIEQDNFSAAVSAIREQNKMLGFHREAAPNPEKEAARRAIIEEELKELRQLASIRTAELSQGCPKVFKLPKSTLGKEQVFIEES